MRKVLSLSLLLFALFATPLVHGQWKTLKTISFVLFYRPEYEEQAWELLYTLEHYRKELEELIGNRAKRLAVVIEDAGSLSYGFADPVFYNIHLFTYPPSGGELQFMPHWWSGLGVHEYTHLLHLTTCSGFPAVLTVIFGRALAPNLLCPTWISEGMAVYAESRFSAYSGRLNDGYYDAYLGTLVSADRFPSLAEATYVPPGYPGGTGPYLYGGEFFNYLSRTYGEGRFSDFFRSYGSSILSYLSPLIPALGLDRAARRVYGKSFRELWRDWQTYEAERFQGYRQEGERLTRHGWKVGNPLLQEGKLFFTRAYPVRVGPFRERRHHELIELDLWTGKESLKVTSPAPFTASLRIREGRLFYTTLEVQPGFANIYYNRFGFTSVLHELDLEKGRSKKILTDRIRAYTVLSGGGILYAKDRSDSFGSDLYLLNKGGEVPELLSSSEYLVGDLLADDSTLYLSARRDFRNFSLYTLDLQALVSGRMAPGFMQLTPLLETPYLEGSLALSGKKLFFAANYEGTYSVFCYDPLQERFYRLTRGGYGSAPAYDESSGELYFLGLNTDGSDIYRRKAAFEETRIPSYPPLQTPVLSPPEGGISRGGYLDNLATLFPRLLFPAIQIDTARQRILAGLGLMGITALGDFEYLIRGLYNFTDKQPEIDLVLKTSLMAPLISTLSFTTIDYSSLSLSLEYPLYRSLSGVSSFSIGISGRIFQDDFSRREIKPFTGLGFRFPRSELSFLFSLPFERVELGSSLNSLGLIAGASWSQHLLIGELMLGITGVYDLDQAYWILPALRGYNRGLITRAGAVIRLDYIIPLFRIRKGLWNPGIFFQDLFIQPFSDWAVDYSGFQFSTGLEIHLEIKALALTSGVPLDAWARFAVNKQGEPSLGFFLKSPLTEWLVRDKQVGRHNEY